jgi:hypothetical protein
METSRSLVGATARYAELLAGFLDAAGIDRRYVADRGVVTTTGITASLPVSLALVEAIGGRAAGASARRRPGRYRRAVWRGHGGIRRPAVGVPTPAGVAWRQVKCAE